MRFGVLGPLEVWNDAGDRVSVGGPQQRALLAVLLVNAGRVVSADRLIDHLWGERPPRNARALLQGCVAGLRRGLRAAGRVTLVTRAPGYLLDVRPGELDVDRFEELATAARRASSAHEGAALLYEALGLWRGHALDDVAVDGLQPYIARLADRHLEVIEQRIDVDLRLGRTVGLVGELQARVREHPLRERLWAQLMRALHRAGRQADALAAYRELRRTLVDQLGVEPGQAVRDLHRAILACDADPATGDEPVPVTHPVAAAVVTPSQLPAAMPAFTGRAEHLKHLDELAGDPAAMVIAIVTGTAGVGKTALAVHWGHRVREQFPDGQLYVNLRGHAQAPPMRPVEALTGFLTGLGVPAEQIPVDVEPAAALFRSMLAGKRVLVVLDNAASAEQVRPLLPGTAGCLSLVTSRDRLTGLVARDGARRLTLDVLPPDEAYALLAGMLGEDRTAAESGAVEELARLCAYLPLALRIAAAEVTGSVAARVAELVADDRLGALEFDSDAQSAVRLAFDSSYAALPDAARRLFRLLGLVPGTDLTAAAVAALAGVPDREARALLGRLAAAHLVDEQGGRYTFHDLLRMYAAERAHAEDTDDERRIAIDRLYDWYAAQVDAAARALNPEMLRLPPAVKPTTVAPALDFDDHQAALAWLDAERSNLVQAIRHAATAGPARACSQLADALRGYFWLRMCGLDWLDVAGCGLAAATDAGDFRGQAAAHLSLGDAYGRQSRYERAIEHYTQALALNRATGWTDGESAALGNLGNVYWWAGRLPEAAEHYAQALSLARARGRLAGQAVNLGNLGEVHRDLGELERAADHHRQALDLDRRLGSRLGEAVDLSNLGELCREMGRLDEAFAHLDRAIALHREIGDRSGEAETLRVQAAAHRDAGQVRHALELATKAGAIARETGDVRCEADALNTLGTCEALLGHDDRAVARHETALRLARSSGTTYSQIAALVGLAGAHREPDAALSAASNAVALAQRSGYRLLEGHALVALGHARRRSASGDGTADWRAAQEVFAGTNAAAASRVEALLTA